MGGIVGNLFARLIIALLKYLVVIPIHALWLAGKRTYRRRHESTWPITRGTVEQIRIAKPEYSSMSAPVYSRPPRRWDVAVTFSYSHAGEYYSGGEERTFLVRSAANRFISLLENAASGSLLSSSQQRMIVRVAVNPEHPGRAFIVGFFEDAETFARNIEGAVPAESIAVCPMPVR